MEFTLDRFHGCLAGLAAGDALGTAVEFSRPGTFKPLRDMVGGGVFGLRPGQWTDDTSMALCLAESLLETGGFDPADQMNRYVSWFREGYMSSTGTCFDIGNATREALLLFERTGEPFSGSSDPYSAGNGSIMRLAPVPMFYAADPAAAVRFAVQSSRTTHGTAECLQACGLLACYLLAGLRGRSKTELLEPDAYREWMAAAGLELSGGLAEILGGSYRHKEPPAIKGSGYVVQSLEAALWAFDKSSNFEDGALLAVNLGDDADTTGAVYGQIAGAYYGYDGIPESWREKLAMRGEIEETARKLHGLQRA
ncbi:ADP-ribosylglycohydrolase family protein [Paenibacillus chitinolyticus]|uniref:ADP-ribosylglycohydrolase family protein n=1 Tax=Paenibacillus chitinolyticus TaxID=79263 RepID=UPI001C44BF19|nr:ADP-ribosylglycohydrolase family protein [Paenibacillus chitinolyticus]MBV6712495.1 ADP-ribosylglycohydrolase family protein [Paenibacillus chitinolyticus]